MMLKRRRKQMIDAVYIVLVLEDPREFPNNRCVSTGRIHILPLHSLYSRGVRLQQFQLPPKDGRIQFALIHIDPKGSLWRSTMGMGVNAAMCICGIFCVEAAIRRAASVAGFHKCIRTLLGRLGRLHIARVFQKA